MENFSDWFIYMAATQIWEKKQQIFDFLKKFIQLIFNILKKSSHFLEKIQTFSKKFQIFFNLKRKLQIQKIIEYFSKSYRICEKTYNSGRPAFRFCVRFKNRKDTDWD